MEVIQTLKHQRLCNDEEEDAQSGDIEYSEELVLYLANRSSQAIQQQPNMSYSSWEFPFVEMTLNTQASFISSPRHRNLLKTDLGSYGFVEFFPASLAS